MYHAKRRLRVHARHRAQELTRAFRQAPAKPGGVFISACPRSLEQLRLSLREFVSTVCIARLWGTLRIPGRVMMNRSFYICERREPLRRRTRDIAAFGPVQWQSRSNRWGRGI